MMGKDAWTLIGAPRPFDQEFKFVTSPFLSPLVLGAIRLLLAFYTLTTLLTILIREAVITHDADSFFSYFTELSYIGLCSYFWASAVQTLCFARRSGDKPSYPLQTWPRFLQFLHSLLWSTVTVFPFIVTPVFWILLSSPSTFKSTFSAWENISVHALNSVFALFEITVSNVSPQPWVHSIFLIILLGAYLCVAYITHATQGFYTYSFLNPVKEKGFLAVYIVAIAIAGFAIFFIVRGLCWLKNRLFFRSSLHGVNLADEYEKEAIVV